MLCLASQALRSAQGDIENPGLPCESSAFPDLSLRPLGDPGFPPHPPPLPGQISGHPMFMSTELLLEGAGFCSPGGCLAPAARCLCTRLGSDQGMGMPWLGLWRNALLGSQLSLHIKHPLHQHAPEVSSFTK